MRSLNDRIKSSPSSIAFAQILRPATRRQRSLVQRPVGPSRYANPNIYTRTAVQCPYSKGAWEPWDNIPRYRNSCVLYEKLSENLVARVHKQTASGPMHMFFLDFEATYVPAVQQDIIQLCFQHHASGRTHSTLVKPRMDIHPVTIEKTGINRETVEGEEYFDARAGPLLEWMLDCMGPDGGVPVLVAHNASQFDVPLLTSQLARCGLTLPTSWRFFDTLPFHKVLFNTTVYKDHIVSGHSKSSLEAVREQFGLQSFGPAHNAEVDVKTLAGVVDAMAGHFKFVDAQEMVFAVVEAEVLAEVLKGQEVGNPVGAWVEGRKIQLQLPQATRSIAFGNKFITGYAYQTLEMARTTLSKTDRDEPWVQLMVDAYGGWILVPKEDKKKARGKK